MSALASKQSMTRDCPGLTSGQCCFQSSRQSRAMLGRSSMLEDCRGEGRYRRRGEGRQESNGSD